MQGVWKRARSVKPTGRDGVAAEGVKTSSASGITDVPRYAAAAAGPLIMALEPRLMFDASIAPTVAHAADSAHAPAPDVTVKDPSRDIAVDARPVATELTAASTSTRHDIVFIDSQVSSASQLATALPSSTEVVVLDGSKDGFAQMASYVSGRHDIDSISLISHGSTGAVQAGSVWLNADTLASHTDALKTIGASLSPSGDLMLYGCRVGEGSAGQQFLDRVAAITSADVAASTGNTGAAVLGGDWTLERSTGSIEAPALDAAATSGYQALLAAPVYETFDTYPFTGTNQTDVVGSNGSYSLNGWTFQTLRSNGTLDNSGIVWMTNDPNQTVLANTADGALLVQDTSNTTAAVVFKSTSGEAFKFNSITFEDGQSANQDYRLVGYLDGVQVTGATQVFSLPYYATSVGGTTVSVSGTPWQYVDEVRVVLQNGSVGVSVFMDDLNVSAAVSPNVPPVIGNLNGDAVTFVERSGPVLLDAGLNVTVTDGDSANFDGGYLKAQIVTNLVFGQDVLTIQNQGSGAGQIGLSGTADVTYGGTIIGTFSGGTGTNPLVVSFNASATPTAVRALIDSIAYNNLNTSDPSVVQRTVSFTLNDGDSLNDSAEARVNVVVQSVNDAPTLSATGANPTYTENGAGVSLFTGASVSAVEASQGIRTLTFSVSNVADGAAEIMRIDGTDIALFNGNTATTATNGMSVSVSMSGGVATITVDKGAGISSSSAAALVNGITYRDTSDNPVAGNRVVTLTSVRDTGGTANGGVDTTPLALGSTVNVVAVNDPPVVTTSGGSAAFTAGDNASSIPVVVDSALTLSDLDSTAMASAVVRISGNFRPGEDQLIFINNNSALYGNITASYNAGTGMLTLTSSGSTATISQWQAALRTVRYSDTAVTPNTATRTISFVVNDGGADSVAANRNITVTAVDQTPLLSTTGGSSSFTEGQGPVAADPGLTVSDLDNSTLSFATVQIAGNFRSGEDLLLFTNTSSTTYGNITASYNAGTGTLTLVSSGATATLAQWQAALRGVQYTNTSVNPDGSTRTLSFSISDGIKTSAVATRDVTVTPVDIPPVLTGTGGSVTFTEGNGVAGTPVVIHSSVSLSDADSTTLASATVSITGNFQSGADQLGFANTNSSLYGNIAASYDAATGVLSLSSTGATATIAQWQAALRAVTYANGSDTPSASTRTVSFVVSDGGVSSNAVTRDVNVVAVDDSPVLSGGAGTPVFHELDGQATPPVPVAADLSLNDADSSTLVSATVSITGNLHTGEDLLAFANSDPTQFGNITASYNAATGVLTLGSAGGTATAAQWQAALRSVTYSNGSEAPNTANRVISITVNDGNSDSNTVSRNLTVLSTNDTPVNTAPGAVQHLYQDGSLVFGSAQGNALSISDADAGNGLMQVTLTVTQGTLSLSGTTGLSFAVGSGTGDATMTFSGSIADINAALQGLSFSPTAGYRGPASLQITTDDLGNSGGPAATDSDTIALSVDPTFPAVIGVSTPTPDGGYKVGDTITTTLTFDQAVTVDTAGGTPTLLMETGNVDRQAVYQSGSGTNTLTFTYVVQAGDIAARLDYASAAALALNGASIRSATQFDALLALPAPGSGDSLAGQHAIRVDGVAPVVTGVRLPASGTYVAGQSLDFTVDYSEAVTLGGNGAAPRLAVTLDDGRTAYADYVSGSGSTSLVFRLTVQAGQQASGGLQLGGSLEPGGSVLTDGVGNTASTVLNGLGSTAGIRVDAVLPTVSSITRLDGSATNGQPVRYQVTFSEAVAGVDAADFSLTTTGNAGASITGVTQVDGRTYVVEVGQLTGAGQLSLQLAAAGSGIADAAGNALAADAQGPAYGLAQVAPPPLPPAAPTTVAPLLVPTAEVAVQTPQTFEPPAVPTGTLFVPVTKPLVTGLDVAGPAGTGAGSTTPALSAVAALSASLRPDPLRPDPLDPGRVFNATPRADDSRPADTASPSGRATPGLERPTSVAVAAGEPLRIALPIDTLSSLGRDGPTTVEVRQSNGRPLPAWLRFDPITGTLVGRAPPGLNQKISIEVVVRDAKGQRTVSTVDVEVKATAPRPGAAATDAVRDAVALAGTRDTPGTGAADAAAAPPPTLDTTPGRAGLASQFGRHGHAAWQAERLQWSQVLMQAEAMASLPGGTTA